MLFLVLWSVPARFTFIAAPAESRRGILSRLVGLLPLASSAPEPAHATDPGSQLAEQSGLGALLGLDTAEAKLFSTDLFAANGSRVKIRFSAPWPVRSDGYGGLRAGFEARRSNQYPGEAASTVVVKRIGVDSVQALPTVKLLEKVFAGDALAGAASTAPENVKQVGKAKLLTGPRGSDYRVVGAKFTRVSGSGMETESHAYLSATVVAGDLFALVATCREYTWKDSQSRMIPTVESFQAIAA